ncbi:unnamed protein product [Blepharisma stoltei]|uniref:G-protein coupled receptors family 2 profile 2 domain-containing protein n=1 Tax=Blepharisma stoltei TaxID=1481888 RepID=A0AAU9KCB9_9CILI|nr:unnamed protein product [Blepharisma stoltei]
MALSSSQNEAFSSVLIVCNSLSIFGCLFIIFLYLIFGELRTFAFRLVFHMSIVDLFHSISLLPGYEISEWLCIFQGSLLQYTSFGGAVWSVIIAYSLFDTVVLHNTKIQAKESKFLIIGYIFPVLVTIPPFVTKSYGSAEGWCWISISNDHFTIDTIWRFVLFYIPLWLMFIYNIVTYFVVINNIIKEFKNLDNSDMKTALVRRLRMYPFVLIFSYLFSTIKRIYDFINPEEEFFPLIICAGAMLSLVGFLNGFVYGFTDSVKVAIKEAWIGGKRTNSYAAEGSQSLMNITQIKACVL